MDAEEMQNLYHSYDSNNKIFNLSGNHSHVSVLYQIWSSKLYADFILLDYIVYETKISYAI